MRKLCLLLCLFVAVSCVFADNYDLFFHDDGVHGLCIGTNRYGVNRRNAMDSEKCELSLHNDIRIRVVKPQSNPNKKLGFDLVRPFFILDGIYLGMDSLRTLESFHEEALQFGLTDLLVELGYTPVLVQFAETVRRPLTYNAANFTRLLHFVNDNKFFGFPNKMVDGMIVLGISQGGVLGRYGAYKYDVSRKASEAPIRIYGSLDSPHQGAVMPKGLFYTINFWATYGGSADAEKFFDLLRGPGSSELMVTNMVLKDSVELDSVVNDFSNKRFLYGEYRKAAEYKKYPSILIAQGQLKGSSPLHPTVYYKLNRLASKFGIVLGRAQSVMQVGGDEKEDLIAYNRVYKMSDKDEEKTIKSSKTFDFVQGSTYPFARTIYRSLRNGFESAMPVEMEQKIVGSTSISLSTFWDADTLIQGSSTFIPTTSALDLICSNGLSIWNDCAFTAKDSDISFEQPGALSSGTAVYAVDPTHPRYEEPISGRHIELPVHSDGTIDTVVLQGMQVDIWRFLCEVAKYDYDETKHAFRNELLTGVFEPKASCMDLTKVPEIIRISGFRNVKSFGYARFDYNKIASEINEDVTFDVPAGWHKVAVFDNGAGIQSDVEFVVDVTVNRANSSWMKAELILNRAKDGPSQLQLQEISIPVDGKKHTLRWPMSFSDGALSKYRWLRLVLNSDGGNVTISKPRFEKTAINASEPSVIMVPVIYPNTFVTSYPMASTTLQPYHDGYASGLKADFRLISSSFFMNFGERKNLNNYTNLKVTYWPGTCQKTSVYFDSFTKGKVSLKDGSVDGIFIGKRIPLASIIDTEVTPNHGFSASRLVFQSTKSGESCVIKDVTLE